MNIYYTNLKGRCLPQTVPWLSLGGYCSDTKVLSGASQAVFSDLSQLTLEQRKPVYICLVLKNDTSAVRSGITIWTETDVDHYGTIKAGFCEPSLPDLYYTPVKTIFTKPYYVDFYDIEGQANAATLPDLQPDGEIGIWLERTIDINNIAVQNASNCQWLYENKDIELPTEEQIIIKVDYN